MKVKESHYTKYLISVHFNREYEITETSEQVELCRQFLNDLAEIAKKSGIRLYATFSVCNGENGCHAHFGVNWLPLKGGIQSFETWKSKYIDKKVVSGLLEKSMFFVDNPKEAIKHVNRNREYVTKYITEQPRDNQMAIYSEFFIYGNLEPNHSREKPEFYCSSGSFLQHTKSIKNDIKSKIKSLFLISCLILFLISEIIVMIN